MLLLAAVVGVAFTTPAATVFSDDFTSSTLNPATMSAPTPTSTSYAILADKNALQNSSITANDFKVAMNSTSTGRVQAQARFATSPLTLATTGDYVELRLTFINTANLLMAGSSSYLGIGLFNSGGADPVADGVLASSGLSSTAGSPYATGNAAGWVGYNARLGVNTLASRFYTRPIQDGSGTTSRNQDVIFNESSGYSNPSGVQIGADNAFGSFLIQDNTYTYTFRLTFDAGTGFLNVTENLYDGAGTGGANLFSHSGTTTDSTTPTLSFDSLGFGWKHSPGSAAGASASTMDISWIEVTAQIIPEPTSASLSLIAAGIIFMIRNRRQA
jgi:hypothetical protein